MKKKRTKQKILWRGSFFALLTFIVVVISFGFFLSTFDANAYRQEIAQALGKKLSRQVEIKGPMSLALSLFDGFSLELTDVVVGNPAWASQPDMAKVGKFLLSIEFWPLLQKKIRILAFDLEEAQIQFETNKEGKNNWTFGVSLNAEEKSKTVKSKTKSQRVSFFVKKATVLKSKIGFKSGNGKLILFDVPSLLLEDTGKALQVHFLGVLNGVPTEVNLTGGSLDLLARALWPYQMAGSLGNTIFEARGNIDQNIKNIIFDSIFLRAEETIIVGQASAFLDGKRPLIKGSFKSQKMNSDSFKFSVDQDAGLTSAEAERSQKKKLFSRDKLDLEGLKNVDLQLHVNLDEIFMGPVLLKNVLTQINLVDGVLTLSPFSALVGDSQAKGNLRFDASAPRTEIDLNFEAKRVELSKLLKYAGAESVFSGKADMDFQIKTMGNSPYSFVSNANGTLNFLMDSEGVSSTSAFKNIAGKALDYFVPGIGVFIKTGINCFAGRYTIKQGFLETKGLLIDTEMTSIMGSGHINLPDEHMSMIFRTKPKAVGSIVPPMKLYGDLLSPQYTIDGEGAVKKVVGLFVDTGAGQDGVPDVVPVKGYNACAYALDNPENAKKMRASHLLKKPLLPDSTILSGSGDVGNVVKDLGSQFMNSLGGSFFGE